MLPRSCRELKAERPTSEDGMYELGPVAFSAYCDMAGDSGGWMLVTPEMIASEQKDGVTSSRSVDSRGGLVLRVWANVNGCGSPGARYQVLLKDVVPWTQVRSYHLFKGSASVWSIWGDGAALGDFAVNLLPFDKAVDVVRLQAGMGGSKGDAFDGLTHRADNLPENFWHGLNGTGPRTAEVILRRKSSLEPAGLATGTSCTPSGPGVASPTYWGYSNIYVR